MKPPKIQSPRSRSPFGTPRPSSVPSPPPLRVPCPREESTNPSRRKTWPVPSSPCRFARNPVPPTLTFYHCPGDCPFHLCSRRLDVTFTHFYSFSSLVFGLSGGLDRSISQPTIKYRRSPRSPIGMRHAHAHAHSNDSEHQTHCRLGCCEE